MDIFAARSAQDRKPGPFADDADMKAHIDSIKLDDVPWKAYGIKYTGDQPVTGHASTWMKKNYEVWYRDPRQVVKNMLANQDFEKDFDYVPTKNYRDGKREWSNFMSGNWAWKQAVCIQHLFLHAFN